MSEPRLDYLPENPPREVGAHAGKRIMNFGYYRLAIGEKRWLFPHSATEASIGADPLDTEDADIIQSFVEAAERLSPSPRSTTTR